MVDCPVPYPYSFTYVHPLLFVVWYFAVSRVLGVALVVKMHHSDPAMDRRIRTTGHPEQVFELCRAIFEGLKGAGGRNTSHHCVSAKKRKKH
jgi:hypothetical protein